MPNIEFIVNLYDSELKTKNLSYLFNLGKEYMQINAKWINNNGKCYLPIFKHNLEKNGTASTDWYLGAHTLQEQVIMFDNSPHIEHGEAWAQIGLAASIASDPVYHPITNWYGTSCTYNSTTCTNDPTVLEDSSVYKPDPTVDPLI